MYKTNDIIVIKDIKDIENTSMDSKIIKDLAGKRLIVDEVLADNPYLYTVKPHEEEVYTPYSEKMIPFVVISEELINIQKTFTSQRSKLQIFLDTGVIKD